MSTLISGHGDKPILEALEPRLLLSGTTVNIETVPVGNPGNTSDTHGNGYGSVSYEYNIGKYEVSNAEYCEFLNAVATEGDPHGLYNTEMGGGWNDIGGISRSGSGTGGDPWVYTPRANRANRPVNYVNFWDACRFANWLHSGQGAGDTENGAYTLTAGGIASNTVTRNADWKWAVTSEDEWYKAAYYRGGGANTGYWDYPTQSDARPAAQRPPGTDMVNGSANYLNAVHDLTDVGAANISGRETFIAAAEAREIQPTGVTDKPSKLEILGIE